MRALSSRKRADRTFPLWPVNVCWGDRQTGHSFIHLTSPHSLTLNRSQYEFEISSSGLHLPVGCCCQRCVWYLAHTHIEQSTFQYQPPRTPNTHIYSMLGNTAKVAHWNWGKAGGGAFSFRPFTSHHWPSQCISWPITSSAKLQQRCSSVTYR